MPVSAWEGVACQGCGRSVLDEMACYQRVSNGELLCVDCCAINNYIRYGNWQEELEAIPCDHHEYEPFPGGQPIEDYHDDMIEDWLLEIFTATPSRMPDLDLVAKTVYEVPGSYGGIQNADGDWLTREVDRKNAQLVAITEYLESRDIRWGSQEPPTPHRCVINRRAV